MSVLQMAKTEISTANTYYILCIRKLLCSWS